MMVSRYNKRLGAYKEEDILSPVRLAHAPFARVKMFWFLLLDSSVTFTSFTHARKCLLVPLFLEGVELDPLRSLSPALPTLANAFLSLFFLRVLSLTPFGHFHQLYPRSQMPSCPSFS